jgi:XTP/dITP diphosphohydrolase
MKLLLATTNPNKVLEIRAVLGSAPIELVTLNDFPPIPAPEESASTYWENARKKALAYARATGMTAAGEDSGLEILALGREPGVYSARFLGPDVPYAVRFDAIYRRLAALGPVDRSARFVTALAIAEPDGTIVFESEAVIEGEVADAASGAHGFGYDPIFFYPPLGKTTAEMTLDDKCAVSHRARAFRDFARWLASREAAGLPPRRDALRRDSP